MKYGISKNKSSLKFVNVLYDSIRREKQQSQNVKS